MKRFIILLTLISFIQYSAVAYGQLPPIEYEALARTVTAEMVARRFDQVAARFGPAVAQVLDAAKLGASWDGVVRQLGAFSSIESVKQEEKGGVHIVYLTCQLARGKLVLIIGFDESGRIIALTSTLPESSESWKPPAYAKTDAFTERAVTVITSSWELPGTLTVPAEKGPVPAVVLVHGSGPNDQDETIGPNKIFKDLAWGLASRGVAVLRYEKRSHKYRAGSSADPQTLTVADETINDARSAVALLASTTGIDSKRIFVAGHSLGAFVGPRIATGEGRIAGLILMAGNTRPLEELIVEQVRYLNSLNGQTPEGEKQIAAAEKAAQELRNPGLKPGMTVNVLGAKLPASYVLDLRSYNPGETAAALKIPMLVLQGERDYQVRVADFDGWKKALAGHTNAVFKLYPALNHHFMPGTDPASNIEYLRPNHVLEQVINDIAAWIDANGKVK
jgi:uncharacterized protein